MISLESGPCHLQSKVYRGFNANQNWSLDTTKPFISLTVSGLGATVCLIYKFFKTSLLTSKGETDSFGDKIIYLKFKHFTIIAINRIFSLKRKFWPWKVLIDFKNRFSFDHRRVHHGLIWISIQFFQKKFSDFK